MVPNLLPRAKAKELLICERCHAGQMVEYRRKLGEGQKATEIIGRKCDRCGFTQLDNDDDVWAAVGL